MTDKEKIIKELKEALDSLDITNKYRLNIIRAIEYLQEEPVEKDFEEALAAEWKGYNDRGAATVDALEDNTQELAFAKGFYRGLNWKEQQMIANAFDAEVLENYDGKVIKYDDTILDEKLSGCKVFDKVKVIIIKRIDV